jgi:hypothetical protein
MNIYSNIICVCMCVAFVVEPKHCWAEIPLAVAAHQGAVGARLLCNGVWKRAACLSSSHRCALSPASPQVVFHWSRQANHYIMMHGGSVLWCRVLPNSFQSGGRGAAPKGSGRGRGRHGGRPIAADDSDDGSTSSTRTAFDEEARGSQ